MISPRAKIECAKLFPQCLGESLRSEAHPIWRTQPVDGKEIDAKRFIMLTLSSYDFRMLVVLHFSADTAALNYAADSLKIASGELSLPQFHDYLSEVGNLLCGSIKRHLKSSYPNLGISTPNQLGSESIKYVEICAIDHAIHSMATAEDGTIFYGSLYMSSVGDFDIDPNAISTGEEIVEMGALELF